MCLRVLSIAESQSTRLLAIYNDARKEQFVEHLLKSGVTGQIQVNRFLFFVEASAFKKEKTNLLRYTHRPHTNTPTHILTYSPTYTTYTPTYTPTSNIYTNIHTHNKRQNTPKYTKIHRKNATSSSCFPLTSLSRLPVQPRVSIPSIYRLRPLRV